MEINQFKGKSDLAKDFSEAGMKMVYDHANDMTKSNKGKVDQSYIDMNKELFRIN